MTSTSDSGAPSVQATVLGGAELRRICPTCGRRYADEFQNCPEDGQALIQEAPDEHDDNLVGQVVKGTYVFARILGEGAMARVYEASHTRLRGKRFAIKVLHPEFCVYKEVLQRFRREAEAAASIENPHIIQVYDVDDTPDGRPFMVTELLRGVELGDHIFAAGIVPVPKALSIARQLCEALEAAHKAGFVHRDMKPENVFLVGDIQDPTVKIIDFGISKDGNRPGTQLTRMGSVMGTPSFMAPEQAKGLAVSHTADIYAVGGILYNMLTGKRPYDGEHPAQILQDLLTTEPPRPRSLNPAVSEALEEIILKAMKKSPAERYATAAQLGEAIASVADTRSAGATGVVPNAAAAPSVTMPDVTVSQDVSVPRLGLTLSLALATGLASATVATLVSAVIRMTGGRGLGGVGVFVTFAALLLVLAAPLFLAYRYLKERAFRDALEARSTTHRILAPLAAGSVAYASTWLFARLVAAAEASRIDEVSPGWELTAGALALLTALAWTLPLKLRL